MLPQKFLMLFDSGSSNILIPTMGCDTCNKKIIYSRNKDEKKNGSLIDKFKFSFSFCLQNNNTKVSLTL